MWCIHRATSEEGPIIIPICDPEPVVIGREKTLPFAQRIASLIVSRSQFSVSLPVGAVGPHLRHLGHNATLLNGTDVGYAEVVLKDGNVIALEETTLPVYTVGRTEAMVAATPAAQSGVQWFEAETTAQRAEREEIDMVEAPLPAQKRKVGRPRKVPVRHAPVTVVYLLSNRAKRGDKKIAFLIDLKKA